MRIGLAVVALVAAVAAVYALFQALDERSAPPILIEDAAATLPVVADVRGEVEAAGVYELPPGARLQDAIAAAGGLTEEADLSTLNLARRLRDGELIVILALPAPAAHRRSPRSEPTMPPTRTIPGSGSTSIPRPLKSSKRCPESGKSSRHGSSRIASKTACFVRSMT